MSRKVRIGTRESALALWQANFVRESLEALGIGCELVTIKSDGEKDLVTPLYEMGVQGIFTKTLDIALLQGKIDLAVHSQKDVPTQLPHGLSIAAVPKRGNHRDVLVYKSRLPSEEAPYLVATSSLRRSAQWFHRYPEHTSDVLRGNINTRLQKLLDNQHWDGALFATAGIERIELDVPNALALDWMLPAPAQGALAIVARTEDADMMQQAALLNDEATEVATSVERAFLRELMGGCSMPIGALAQIKEDRIFFSGCVLTKDGKQIARSEQEGPVAEADQIANTAAQEIWNKGGRQIIETFSKQ
jgi:hydroxymethylbilane synthase